MISASLACGLILSDWDKLSAGQIVDIVFTRYNQVSEAAGSNDSRPTKRVATQADWDAFSS